MDEGKSKSKGEEQEAKAMAALQAYKASQLSKSAESKEEERIRLKQKKKDERAQLPKLPAKVARTMIRAYLKGGWKRNGVLWQISGDVVYGSFSPKNAGSVLPCEINPTKKQIKELSKTQFECVVAGAMNEMEERYKFDLLKEFQSIEWFYQPKNIKETASWLLLDNSFRIKNEEARQRWGKEDNITAFALKSDPSWTYHRLDFDLTDEPWPTPSFDKLMENFNNSRSLMAFIGSLFDSKSYMQQYVWIFGGGQNGKGKMMEALSTLLGRAFFSRSSIPNENDRFWTSNLVNARLVVFSDCDNKGFVRTGLFKALTGGDQITIERKNHDAYSAKLECKFIFLSNDEPSISNQHSETRRIIFVEAKQTYDGPEDPLFAEKLHGEVKDFVIKCFKVYREVCPVSGLSIPQDKENISRLIEEFDAPVDNFIKDNFVISEESFLTVQDFEKVYANSNQHISKTRIHTALAQLGVEKVKRRMAPGENPKWCWKGLRKIHYNNNIN